MTTRECEKKLLALLDEAYVVFKECHPDGNHLTMFAGEHGYCAMGYKLSAKGSERRIDGYMSPIGNYRFSE